MKQIENIALRLKDIGFTIYEAKTYISLLQNNPVTRYELSKNSGVPRSAIYGVIKNLENIGAVNALYSEPEKYVPLPAAQLFKMFEEGYKDKIEKARESLKGIEASEVTDHLWNIVGYHNMIQKAKELIRGAAKELDLSIWRREYKLVRNELHEAAQRGVKITIFSFTEIDFKTDSLFSYDLKEKDLEKIWDHKIILVADKKELLMGDADNKVPKKTAWTSNKAIVDIAMNHIILDITLFGLRMNITVDNAVRLMQNGESGPLSDLLAKKYPEKINLHIGTPGNGLNF